MRKYLIFTLVLTGLVAPSYALGQKTDLFKAEMGLAIPFVGDLEDVADAGVMLGGQWIHRISPDMGLGAELSYISYGDKSIGGGEISVDMLTLMGLTRFDLNSTSSKEPYLLAGLGITQTDLEVNGNSDDDTSPTLLFGGGVDIPLNKVTLGLEARYQHFFFDFGSIEGGGALQLLGQLRW